MRRRFDVSARFPGPASARKITDALRIAFTEPTHRRFVVLLLAAILTVGARTVSNVLRVVGRLAVGHPSSYHRVFSRRCWDPWRLARALAHLTLGVFCPEGLVPVVGDDTVDEHRGAKVYGKGCHRDAVRSSHRFTAWRWGHKWVVLAVLVRVPATRRPWALPLLVALYRPAGQDRQQGRRHKTCPVLIRQMLAVLLRWFAQRRFGFAGDGGYATHELAGFAQRHRDRLSLVSRFYPEANLYAPAPVVDGGRQGRPRRKGRKLPSPAAVVAGTRKRCRLTVAWYGGETRRVEVVSGTGGWYRSGAGLVPVRWVYVHDLSGTHRDEYFFTTDLALTPRAIIERFTGRWSIEVTFEELRAYLGLETTRGRMRTTVLRVAPCLFGLYTVVVLYYQSLTRRWRHGVGVGWVGKERVTFSDAITAVRRWLWVEWIFEKACPNVAFSKLPGVFRHTVLSGLAPAA